MSANQKRISLVIICATAAAFVLFDKARQKTTQLPPAVQRQPDYGTTILAFLQKHRDVGNAFVARVNSMSFVRTLLLASQPVRQYANDMAQIDLADCPIDFQNATDDYVRSIGNLADFISKTLDANPEAILEGFGTAGISYLRNMSRFKEMYYDSESKWRDLVLIAKRYGVTTDDARVFVCPLSE